MAQTYKLYPAVQHYDWGGQQYIPQLLGFTPDSATKYAEIWMGVHAGSPASIEVNGNSRLLKDWLNEAPQQRLGKLCMEKFDAQLPYLFKILDVQKMLSIQAHPTKQAAKRGFLRENEAGVPAKAPFRNYKDDNHKPEIMVALTDFWLLHGFRTINDCLAVLDKEPELIEVSNRLRSSGNLSDTYQWIMTMPQPEVDRILAPLADRLTGALEANILSKDDPRYWAALALRDFTLPDGSYDRGVFSIYLLNLVFIPEGKGIFQDAGIPHAYLEGVNVELMSNSDNVFRGGLTSKHIDVNELMEHTVFEPVTPHILGGQTISLTEAVYPCPVDDFLLSRLDIPATQKHLEPDTDSPRIFILLEGRTETSDGMHWKSGDCLFLPAGSAVDFLAIERSLWFKAGIPA